MVSAERHPIIERSHLSDVSVGFCHSSVATDLPSLQSPTQPVMPLPLPSCGTAPTMIVVGPASHKCPRNSCTLVGERYGCDIHRAAIQQSGYPTIRLARRSFAPADNGSGTVDEQPANVPIASLRD